MTESFYYPITGHAVIPPPKTWSGDDETRARLQTLLSCFGEQAIPIDALTRHPGWPNAMAHVSWEIHSEAEKWYIARKCAEELSHLKTAEHAYLLWASAGILINISGLILKTDDPVPENILLNMDSNDRVEQQSSSSGS